MEVQIHNYLTCTSVNYIVKTIKSFVPEDEKDCLTIDLYKSDMEFSEYAKIKKAIEFLKEKGYNLNAKRYDDDENKYTKLIYKVVSAA